MSVYLETVGPDDVKYPSPEGRCRVPSRVYKGDHGGTPGRRLTWEVGFTYESSVGTVTKYFTL